MVTALIYRKVSQCTELGLQVYLALEYITYPGTIISVYKSREHIYKHSLLFFFMFLVLGSTAMIHRTRSLLTRLTST